MNCILCEVLLEIVAVDILKFEEELAVRGPRRVSDMLLQMLDQNGSSQTVAGCDGLGSVCRDAELFIVAKPDDMEVASTLLKIGEKSFCCMNCMQELESSW